MTTASLIADVTSGQAFNPYSYVGNNPLTYVDPSGFQGEPAREPILPQEVRTWIDEDGTVNVEIKYPPRGAPPPGKGPREDSQVGVFAPPTDMDTTGSSGDATAAAVEPEPRSWTQHRVPQLLSGFWGGVGLGLVPFAGTVEQALERGEVIDPMTPSMQEGFALGLIVGGVFTMVDGLSVGVGGVAATVTGVGAPVGVPTIAAAAVVAAGGAANVVAGLQSLMAGPKGPAGSGGGPRAGKDFTRAGKRQIDAENAASNDGKNKCENCGVETVPGQRSQKGVSPSGKQRERDHIVPRSRGGDGSPDNGQILCRDCNLEKSNKVPE